VRIQPDGEIVIVVNRVELGQGTSTALPMILADEMDADWSRVTAELAPAADVYGDPLFVLQIVAGSASIANSFTQYRELGAKTRAILIAAAAERWSVPAESCRAADSVVHGPNGHSATYAALAEAAARQPIPTSVALKDPSQFRLIGVPTRRIDGRAKTNGSFKFTLDFDAPGMKVALVAHPPVFGARVRLFDATRARAIAGVVDVFEIPLARGAGVAVVADRYWTAKRARDALEISWDETGVERVDSAQLAEHYRALARQPGRPALNRGNARAIDRAPTDQRLVFEYEFPYLAHAPMEPLSISLRYDGDRAEVWSSGQGPTVERATIATELGLQPEQVTHHILPGGGAFGRRGSMDLHLEREGAAIAKRLPGATVKLMWSREDDIRGGYYRPAFVHRAEIAVDPQGMPTAWRHVIVGQSFIIGSGTFSEPILVHDGVDFLGVEGIVDSPYRVPNFHVSAHHPQVNVPTLSWRSIGHSHSAYARECVVDELAERAGVDPIAYRLALVDAENVKSIAVLHLLAEKSASWRANLRPGHALGVALSQYLRGACACIVDVSLEGRRWRIHRAMATVHCGLAVNPLAVAAQFQGGLVFGLSQLMAGGAITLRDGRVEQRNFDTFQPPSIKDAPAEVEVHIIPSTDPPTGVGEAPVPLMSPAVSNAVSRLTGRRYRALPIVAV